MASYLKKKYTERTLRKSFRCDYEDNVITKFPKRPKDNKKRQNQVRFIGRGNLASQK